MRGLDYLGVWNQWRNLLSLGSPKNGNEFLLAHFIKVSNRLSGEGIPAIAEVCARDKGFCSEVTIQQHHSLLLPIRKI